MSDERLASLEARILALESEVRDLRHGRPQVDVSPFDAVAARRDALYRAAASRAASTPPAAGPQRRPDFSLETLVAGRGMQVAGLVLVLCGAAFFLQLAFTRGWIGPLERILIGLVIGSVTVAVAVRLGPASRALAEGLVGLGAGIVYLSLWASVAVFPELDIPRAAAAAGMMAMTAVLGLLAERRRSIPIALLGLGGGFLTPLLLQSGSPDRGALAAYLEVLTVLALLLAVRNKFTVVALATFGADLVFSPAFAPVPASLAIEGDWSTMSATITATLFACVFAGVATYEAMRSRSVRAYLVLLGVDIAFYLFALERLYGDNRTILGIALLALAATLFAVASVRAIGAVVRRAYVYGAVGAATLAVPALLHDTSIVQVFIVESALLATMGVRAKDRTLVAIGGILFGLMGLSLVGLAITDPRERGLALAIGFALWVGLAIVARRFVGRFELANEDARTGVLLGEIATHVVALFGLSRACVDLLGIASWSSMSSGTQFAISLLWSAYATALFAYGLRRGNAKARWEAIALFIITVLKVFAIDLASLAVEYRIGSFVVVGGVLFAVSAWYTRSMAKRRLEAEA